MPYHSGRDVLFYGGEEGENFALASTIVCCGASTVAHFASKVSYSASPQTFAECSCTAAPERGSYSRIGACPYLSPQLINSRFCPCKGLISLAGLAPQHLSRYEPLTGARFINRPQEVGASPYPKYEPLSGAACAATLAASALKGQPVHSPGQRPGYQCINAYAL